MNCKTVRTLMSEYIDRRLDPGHAASFRAHLDECPACRRDLAAMEKTVALVRSMKLVALPADLIQSVHARLEAREKPRTSLRPMKVFQPLLAIAAGLVLVAGIGAYFLLEHGRRPGDFTVASVEHKQAFKAAVAEKPQEAQGRMSANEDADQELRLKDKAVALRSPSFAKKPSGLPQGEMVSLAPEGSAMMPRGLPQGASQNAGAVGRGGAGYGQAAPLPAQAEQAGAIMNETATARLTARPERAFAGAAGGAGQGAAGPSPTVRPTVNLTIATTNRVVVEQVLLAFDVNQGEKKEPQDMQLKELARESNQPIVITLAASQLQDLLAQLKLQGTISVTDHDRETAQAPSKMKAEGSRSGAAVESSELLTVQVIITIP